MPHGGLEFTQKNLWAHCPKYFALCGYSHLAWTSTLQVVVVSGPHQSKIVISRDFWNQLRPMRHAWKQSPGIRAPLATYIWSKNSEEDHAWMSFNRHSFNDEVSNQLSGHTSWGEFGIGTLGLMRRPCLLQETYQKNPLKPGAGTQETTPEESLYKDNSWNQWFT